MRSGTCFIANPKAGSVQLDPVDAFVASHAGAALRMTESAGHGRILATEARDEGFDTIVAVGGDGTVSEVVSGIADGPDGVVLGIVPCGTGNDLCRTLAIPLDAKGAMTALADRAIRRIDVMQASFSDRPTLWGVNMAVGGVAGELGDRVDPDLKRRWGPLAYVAEGIKAALEEVPTYELRIDADGKAIETGPLIAVIVGNGRTCGGGRHASPRSDLEDGLLDLVLVQRGSVLDMADIMARLFTGDYTRSDLVTHRRARRISMKSTPPMGFNLDGELVGTCPVVFEVVPARLDVIVGGEYAPSPS